MNTIMSHNFLVIYDMAMKLFCTLYKTNLIFILCLPSMLFCVPIGSSMLFCSRKDSITGRYSVSLTHVVKSSFLLHKIQTTVGKLSIDKNSTPGSKTINPFSKAFKPFKYILTPCDEILQYKYWIYRYTPIDHWCMLGC